MDCRRRLSKLRIAAALRSSLSSCSSRNLTRSLPDSVFLPQPQPHGHRASTDDQLPDLSFFNTSNAGSCGIHRHVVKCASEMMLPRQISDRYLPSAKEDSRHVLRCPPASPITPLNPFLRRQLTPTRAAEVCESYSSSTSSSVAAGLFLSSDDDDDEGSSSECSFSKMTTGKPRGRGVAESSSSYAVVKRSRDPYGDFRRSMVEMIVEKRMYGAGDLERLLEWFLLLNEGRHHAVILLAFTDVWESLHYL